MSSKRLMSISFQLVEFIPERLDEGVLYISKRFGTASHKCCCGCGEKVVTPLNPTDWSLWFDGDAVTLYPSIGNWSYACQSHYWIQRGKVIWAGAMSQKKIEHNRAIELAKKQAYFAARNRKKNLPSEELSKAEPHYAQYTLSDLVQQALKSLVGFFKRML
jgi:Family of unknown function (DUF6527)